MNEMKFDTIRSAGALGVALLLFLDVCRGVESKDRHEAVLKRLDHIEKTVTEAKPSFKEELERTCPTRGMSESAVKITVEAENFTTEMARARRSMREAITELEALRVEKCLKGDE